MVTDILKIAVAFFGAYIVFIVTFYALAKLIFPKVENENEVEESIQAYRKVRARRKTVISGINPKSFRASKTVYPSI